MGIDAFGDPEADSNSFACSRLPSRTCSLRDGTNESPDGIYELIALPLRLEGAKRRGQGSAQFEGGPGRWGLNL